MSNRQQDSAYGNIKSFLNIHKTCQLPSCERQWQVALVKIISGNFCSLSVNRWARIDFVLK